MQRVGGKCDHEECVGVQEIIKTREDFHPGRTRQNGREVSQKNRTVTPVSVCVCVK